MLAALKAMHRWPLWGRMSVTAAGLVLGYLFQIPLAREVPGEPFLLFFLVVISAALAFGQGVGLLAVGLSTFLSFFFFEPDGTFPLNHAADLVRIELYAVLAATSVVGLARLATALIAADEAARALERSERANSVLLRELAHRVANNFASVASLIRRKASLVGDADAKSVLNEAVEQVMVLARVHSRLRPESDHGSLESREFLEELCADLHASVAPGRPLSIECTAVSSPLSLAEAIPLGLIVNELVTNAVKHAFPDGRQGTIRVRLGRVGDRLCLSVDDDGIPLGGGRSEGTGLGLELVRALALQLGGGLEVEPRRPGSKFCVEFPGPKADAQTRKVAAAMLH
jgi:two-component system, sensor histidine kinase PdtaS